MTESGHLPTPTQQKISRLPILKLGDFGFARGLIASDLASTLCGSPLYMAPEILRGSKYDAKSDLWSLGGILYEMITGKPPFRAQNHIELLRKIERGDGWVRFPDETPDMHLQRETLTSRVQRKSALQMPSSAPIIRAHSSPSVPEDLKDLVRKLLNRNPVERMGFEEFFLNACIVECRAIDSRIGGRGNDAISMAGLDLGSVESITSSAAYSRDMDANLSSNVKPLEAQATFESSQLLPAPFPNYGHDPNWSQKVIAKTSTIKISSPRFSEHIIFDGKSPVFPRLAPSSQSSLGSSIGSMEFSSDDEKKKSSQIITKENTTTQRAQPFDTEEVTNEKLGESDEFVVVEKGFVEVKWHPLQELNPVKVPQSPPAFTSSPSQPSSWSRPLNTIQTLSKALSTSLIYGSFPAGQKYGSPSSLEKIVHPPKGKAESFNLGRLFGSLRADNSFVSNPVNHSSHILDQSTLLDVLPFSLDISSLSVLNKSAITQILIFVSRAYCISSLADQFLGDFEIASQTSSTEAGNLCLETLHLFIHSVGLYQYAMNQAKDLWGVGPNITRQGYSFSSSPPDTQQSYLSHLSTLISFVQTQFDMYLDRADRLYTQSYPSAKPRSAQRILFDTSLATCKRGALAEMNESGTPSTALGYYKTSILILYTLLQPSWDVGEGKLEEDDRRDIQNLIDQLSVRIFRLFAK